MISTGTRGLSISFSTFSSLWPKFVNYFIITNNFTFIYINTPQQRLLFSLSLLCCCRIAEKSLKVKRFN